METVVDFQSICDMSMSKLKSQYPVIGAGSSRVVFDIHKKYVLKKARLNDRGIMQTEQEINLLKWWPKCSRLCPIIYSTKNSIVAARTIPLNTPYYKLSNDILRDKFRKFRRKLRTMENIWHYLAYYDNRYYREHLDLNYPGWQKIFRSKIFEDLEDLINAYDLCAPDIWKTSSWGYYQGHFVLIDYGYTNVIANKYYRKRAR